MHLIDAVWCYDKLRTAHLFIGALLDLPEKNYFELQNLSHLKWFKNFSTFSDTIKRICLATMEHKPERRDLDLSEKYTLAQQWGTIEKFSDHWCPSEVLSLELPTKQSFHCLWVEFQGYASKYVIREFSVLTRTRSLKEFQALCLLGPDLWLPVLQTYDYWYFFR